MKKQNEISLRHNPYVHIKNATSGITLIALVITIIVLLILAGVSIASVTGNDGMLTRAEAAVEQTRAAEIKEMLDLAVSENFLAKHTDGVIKTKAQVIAELKTAGKLTAEEETTLASSDTITIAGTEIDFSKLNVTVTYTVIFYDYDGSVIDSVEVESGEDATIADPTRSGYTFSGWVTELNGTETANLNDITENKSVYASYIISTRPSPTPV